MIVFMSPLWSNSTFFLYSPTIQLEKTFFKWSIITLSILSKVNQHLATHQYGINQIYKIWRKIWQDINYNFTESRKSKLGEIWFSVVRFRLIHFSVQFLTWWWSKSSRGLICTKGLYIGFSDIVAIMGKYQ